MHLLPHYYDSLDETTTLLLRLLKLFPASFHQRDTIYQRKQIFLSHRITPTSSSRLARKLMAPFIRFVSYHYDRCFRAHPLATLAIANALCSILGDLAAQLISLWNSEQRQIFNLNYARILRYFFYGLNMGPVSGKWNEILERQFSSRLPKKVTPLLPSEKIPDSTELVEINTSNATGPTLSPDPPIGEGFNSGKINSPSPPQTSISLLTTLQMVIADQLIMAPLSLLFFLCFMGFTEGSSWSTIQTRVHQLFFKLLLANWQVWPIIQLINFKCMPLRLRVPFGAACGIIWTVFLSYAST
ncbi:hypothetical protein O181_041957 [Austropuccinia psidii MF-1]|uniref:Uncharacterized protein n=1 Tax=Austropuccinia psidii MF-1 TaxID=1389203 RepID=A0A9Q3HFD5_9BASI|nr:hypothetical protein [Austropuccinia psidii MF-1]